MLKQNMQHYRLLTAAAALVNTCFAQYDVIIAGGGLSGLGAAKTLSEAGKSFIVLEARGRTGGRVHDLHLSDGKYVEVGAEFLGPTQDKVLALADELHLTLYQTYTEGLNVLFHKGERSLYEANGDTGVIPPVVDEESLVQLASLVGELDEMAGTVDIQAPWNSEHAVEWDAVTFADWLDEHHLSESATFLINIATESIWSVLPTELSLLYTVSYIAAGGNEDTPGSLARLISTEGAEMYRIDGGTELLASRLAQKVGSVQLNAPVSKIAWTGDGYDVALGNGTTVTGTHVIVAMSPPLASLIEYDPPLPAIRRQLCEKMRMPSIGKAIAFYPEPWWRGVPLNLNAQVLSDTGLGRVTFDQSPMDGEYGAIMSFLSEQDIKEYNVMTAAEKVVNAQIAQDFSAYFGDEAGDASQYVLFLWDKEEYSRGGPVAIASPNVYTQFGSALKEPVGNLHFAGTESSDYWVGYMDGALRSGYRAATEVLNAL